MNCKTLLLAIAALTAANAIAQDIRLIQPAATGGLTVMEALHNRHSDRAYSARPLSDNDLSDLMFAASGINRPQSGKITSPTAMNRQELDLYVFTPEAVYLYDKSAHMLLHKASGDHRDIVAAGQDFTATAPVVCVIVANHDRFGSMDDRALIMTAVDAGIMSENIAIFCAGRGLSTVPRATMDSSAIKQLLNLGDGEIPVLNMPVGYPKSN